MMKKILSPATVKTKTNMIPNKGMPMQSLVTNSYYLFLLILVTYSGNSAAKEIADWQLETDKSNVQVYSRQTETGYSEIKAETNVQATPQDLLALLDNIAIADQWIDNCQEIKLLDRPSVNERVVHSFFYAPWPVKNRDMVTYSRTVFVESGVVKIMVSDYSSYYPAIDDYVRIKDVKGQWTLQPIDADQMTVSYQGYGEPSGNLPLWLANNLVKSSTYNTFKNMRTLLEHNRNNAE